MFEHIWIIVLYQIYGLTSQEKVQTENPQDFFQSLHEADSVSSLAMRLFEFSNENKEKIVRRTTNPIVSLLQCPFSSELFGFHYALLPTKPLIIATCNGSTGIVIPRLPICFLCKVLPICYNRYDILENIEMTNESAGKLLYLRGANYKPFTFLHKLQN